MIGIQHIVLAMKPTDGNFAENAIRHGVAGINVDGCRIGTKEVLKAGSGGLLSNVRDQKEYPEANGFTQSEFGRFPPNVILEECESVTMEFPDTGNNWRKSKGSGGGIGMFGVSGGETHGQNDSGSASRFFKQVKEL